MKTGVNISCQFCGKIFYATPSRAKTAKCCSRKCFSKTKKGISLRENLKSDYWLGKKRDKKTVEILRTCNIGKKMTLEQRVRNGERQKGDKHWNWQGGKSEEGKRIKQSIEYSLWRSAVLARDHWTCQKCHNVVGNNLEVHHIKSFSKYPELRLAIDNGMTLCKKCHRKTDNYGAKKLK